MHLAHSGVIRAEVKRKQTFRGLEPGRARESFQRSSRGNEALIELLTDINPGKNARTNDQSCKVFEPRYLGCYVSGRALGLELTAGSAAEFLSREPRMDTRLPLPRNPLG